MHRHIKILKILVDLKLTLFKINLSIRVFLKIIYFFNLIIISKLIFLHKKLKCILLLFFKLNYLFIYLKLSRKIKK